MDDRERLMGEVILADHRMMIALCEVVLDYLDDPNLDVALLLRERVLALRALSSEHLKHFERIGIS